MANAHAKQHNYSLANLSPWPVVAALSAFTMAAGAVTWIKQENGGVFGAAGPWTFAAPAAAPASGAMTGRMTVRFDASVRDLAWDFAAVEPAKEVRVGENTLAFFRATNTSDQTVKGTAVFKVTPESAAAYFYKIQCFCYKEQTLLPGQSVEMPVSFYVDPSIKDDLDARRLSEMTVSYTFLPADEPAAASGKTGG